jgi:HSP20 family molecular chaperone IbpA
LPCGTGCGTVAIRGPRPTLELNANISISMGEKTSARRRGWSGRGPVRTCHSDEFGAGNPGLEWWSLLERAVTQMSRLSLLSNPLLLGFDEIERLVDRASKGANDGYPPYNVERVGAQNGTAELLRITLAVAGFTRDQLDVTLEDRQLTIRGKQQEDKGRDFLYRGIAARQFTRTFVLAEGIEVRSANLANGLLAIDLERLEPERLVRTIEISDRKSRV